jgi:hypothetical protein
MINKRIALVILDGEVENSAEDRHHTRQFVKVNHYASVM